MPEIISPTDRPRTARVSFGLVQEISLDPAALRAGIEDAFVAGTSVERYKREWHMGQTQREDDFVSGRIGFQAAGVTELWNARRKDFEESQLSAGTTSPFVLDLRDGRVAFQIRAGLIRPTSFTGALQALMNTADSFRRWRVKPAVRAVEWEDWRRSIDRLVELRINLSRPNPDYKDRPKVKELIEGLDAETVQVVAKAQADDPGGLQVDDAFVHQMIDHAAKYGSWRAVGEKRGVKDPLKWRSDQEVLPEHTVQADPTTKEAKPEDLRRELEQSDD